MAMSEENKNSKSEYKIIYAHMLMQKMSRVELIELVAQVLAYYTINDLQEDFEEFQKDLMRQLKDEDIRISMFQEREE